MSESTVSKRDDCVHLELEVGLDVPGPIEDLVDELRVDGSTD